MCAPGTRLRSAKVKASGPSNTLTAAAEQTNRDDDLQGAMIELLRQQQRTMETLTNELTTRTRLEQRHASGPNPQPAATTTKARKMDVSHMVAPTGYNNWKVHFCDYVVLTRLKEEAPSVSGRHVEIRAALASDGSELWETGRLRVGDNDDVKVVIEKFGIYLRGQRNPLLDRRDFHLRDQLKNEIVDDYIATLAVLDNLGDYDDSQLVCPDCHRPCHHGTTYRDGRIRERLICGLWDKEMQRKVLGEQFDNQLSLDKVIRICKWFEAATLSRRHWSRIMSPDLLHFANAPRTRQLRFQINGLARQSPKLSASFVGKLHMQDIDVLLPIRGV